MNKCPNTSEGREICPLCGGERGPSGVDGGSWAHLDMSPGSVYITEYSHGKVTRIVLRNGVVIKPKPDKRFVIEFYWEPTIPECGVWDRSTDHPDTYTEKEAIAIILKGRRGYRMTEVKA